MPRLLNYQGIISCSKSVWMTLSSGFHTPCPRASARASELGTAPWTVAEGGVMAGVHLPVEDGTHTKQVL